MKFFVAFGLAICSGSLSAQYRAPDAAPDLMRLIRSEKLNAVLPYVMRDNEVDMWIHAMGPDDPLGFEFGTEPGFVIFTDPGEGRIERAAFGGRRDPELFNVMGGVDEIAAFVAERNPVRIALNYSDIAELDTITDSHFAVIGEAFDEDLGDRIVSADRLIADFLAGRAMAEIALYGRLLMDNTAIIEDQFARIVPGETALSDLSGDVYVRDRDGNEEHNSDYVIQRGDLVGIFHGAEMMDFTQHNGFYGYVLRDGTELFLPLAGVIDLEREVERLSRELGRLEALLRGLRAKLANENFVTRAPEAVVAREREKLASCEVQFAKLRAKVASLRGQGD